MNVNVNISILIYHIAYIYIYIYTYTELVSGPGATQRNHVFRWTALWRDARVLVSGHLRLHEDQVLIYMCIYIYIYIYIYTHIRIIIIVMKIIVVLIIVVIMMIIMIRSLLLWLSIAVRAPTSSRRPSTSTRATGRTPQARVLRPFQQLTFQQVKHQSMIFQLHGPNAGSYLFAFKWISEM